MKEIFISVVVAVSLMLIGMFFAGRLSIGGAAQGDADSGNQASVQNVSMVDGKQIIEVTARGGYSPRFSVAKAGVPTVIRMKTEGTFDCSSIFTLPSLGIREALPSSGVKDIDIPAQVSGTTLTGTCAMGMYSLQVQFQ